MSDDIYSVATPYPDVASLAQGYMNRADGERLLLPLPGPSRPGGGVRFVVYLSDGTPAFAGAGLCTEVSDQGDTVPPEQRYETLIDTLQFDERSRPVYDYIVAVRNAAYAQQQAAAGQGESIEAGEAELAAMVEDAPPSEAPEAYAEADAYVDVGEGAAYEAGAAVEPAAPAGDGQDSAEIEVSAPFEAFAGEAEPESEVLSVPAESAPASFLPDPNAMTPSFVPPPLPTGLLTRPARTTHWQPLPPRRPTPRPSSGSFRYGASGLPRPERPPYPELDPSAFVQRAPRPE